VLLLLVGVAWFLFRWIGVGEGWRSQR
jgi:hypothetical protein